MADTGIKELLEAGVHFGHQTRRWSPRMRRYIFGERDGIHIIDLLQTEQMLNEARDFLTEVAAKGGTVLFVGTKKQAMDAVEEWAGKCEMPFVNRRWLGGLLTNYQTIRQRIKRLHELRELKENDRLALLPTKERMGMEAELTKLEFNLGGVADMPRLPDAIVILDLKTEEIALREAERLEIPIVALVDTNCDPGSVDYVIPGNDDAIRSCELIVRTLGEPISEAASIWRVAEEKRRAEEEKKRQEDAERRRKEEAEKKAKEAAAEAERVEAEKKAKADADKKAKAVAEGKAKAKAAAKADEAIVEAEKIAAEAAERVEAKVAAAAADAAEPGKT